MNWRVLLMVVGLGAVTLAAVEAPGVGEFIRQLGASQFADREVAQSRLVQAAATNAPAVLAICAKSYRELSDPEIRHRLRVVMELVVEKHLFRLPRGFLGVQIQNVFIGGGGRLVVNGLEIPPRSVWVGGVLEDSGAAKAGLRADDVIVAVNGEAWEGEGPGEFTRNIQARAPGSTVKLTVLRGGETNEVTATLGELPEAERERVYAPEKLKEFFEEWWRQNVGEPLPPQGP